MKTYQRFLTGLTAGMMALWMCQAAAGDKATIAFMQQKLGYSQRIVEGIALERYDLVATNGFRLWRMSQTNIWMAIKNPGYIEKTTKFQLDVTDMIDAAREKNTSDILKAYAKVTADCVECHQMTRRDQFVRVLQNAAPAAAAQKAETKDKPAKK